MAEQVLIVGAGPTGLTAALELSRLGIPVRIIDKQPAPPTTSRAIGVQARTLELLEQRGLAEEMVRAAILPTGSAFTEMASASFDWTSPTLRATFASFSCSPRPRPSDSFEPRSQRRACT